MSNEMSSESSENIATKPVRKATPTELMMAIAPRICSVILQTLNSVPKITVNHTYSFTSMSIKHQQRHVPDFEFIWCYKKNYYRVYILLAGTREEKIRQKHAVAIVSNTMEAAEFVSVYKFFHSRRTNNKDE